MSRGKIGRSAAAMLEVILAVALIGTAVLGVVRPVLGPVALGIGTGRVFGEYPSVQATIDPRSVSIETDPELPTLAGQGEIATGDAVELSIPTGTTVSVYDPDLRQFVGLVGSQVLTGLLAVTVLLLLLLLVRTLRHGDPFIPVNARRLYAIAAVVGIGGQAVVFLEAWGRAGVLNHPAVAPYVLQEAQLTLLPLVAGLGIAVAAEVFRQGAALREDVEGLV